ncbi:hypothetical protein [Streptomyces sp. NPDC059979]
MEAEFAALRADETVIGADSTLTHTADRILLGTGLAALCAPES